MDRRCGESLGALVEDEAADRALVVLCPDDEHVGDRRVGDPHLRAGEAVAAVDLLRARHHRARVRAVVRLGEAEAADPFAAGELRQVLLLRRLVAEFEDRQHDQRGLHAHHRAVARIDALDLARDEAVADVVQLRAAVLRRDRRAEQAERRPFRGRSSRRSFSCGTRPARAARACPGNRPRPRRAPCARPRSAAR